MSTEPPRRLLALLDDSAPAARFIEWSSIVAQELARPLEVVYVESRSALVAAALPFTRVLAPGAMQWTPWAPEDVERGYRAQAARLRALAERHTLHRAVRWSLRTVRGALLPSAFELHAESDLMLVGAPAGADAMTALAALEPSAARRRAERQRPVVAVARDASPAGVEAEAVARQLARALGGDLALREAAGAASLADALAAPCDLLVLPRALAAPATLGTPKAAVLLVG